MKIKQLVQQIEKQQINEAKKKIPQISIGDYIQLTLVLQEHEKNQENEKKTKQRLQSSHGVVVSHRGSGLNTTIKIRRISKKVIITQIFPLYSPFIKSLKIIQQNSQKQK